MTVLIAPTNRLFALARSGKRLTPIAVACILAGAFAFIAPVAGILLSVVLLPQINRNVSALASAAQQVIALVAQFVPIALAIWAWVALYERRPFWTLGFERTGALRKYVRGLLVGLVLFGLVVGITAALGDLAYEPGSPQQQGIGALGGVLLVYLGWTIQGPIEELLCRGWLLPIIGARSTPAFGIAISTAVFASLHALNPNVNLLAVVNLCLFGALAALYARWESSLWGVAALHAAWNWAEGNVFGLNVSGQPVTSGILLNLRDAGPDVVTGGPFGPEAGLAVTVVLAIGIVVLVALLRKARLEASDM